MGPIRGDISTTSTPMRLSDPPVNPSATPSSTWSEIRDSTILRCRYHIWPRTPAANQPPLASFSLPEPFHRDNVGRLDSASDPSLGEDLIDAEAGRHALHRKWEARPCPILSRECTIAVVMRAEFEDLWGHKAVSGRCHLLTLVCLTAREIESSMRSERIDGGSCLRKRTSEPRNERVAVAPAGGS